MCFFFLLDEVEKCRLGFKDYGICFFVVFLCFEVIVREVKSFFISWVISGSLFCRFGYFYSIKYNR